MTTTVPTIYEITVNGHLDDHWSDWFSDVTIQRTDDGTSRITAPMADQAQLHGLLASLRDLNTDLISLRTTESPAASALTRTLHTSRLTLRPARATDADPTWTFRQLPQVNDWVTGCPTTIEDYRELFAQPDRLATTVVIDLGPDGEGPVIGDLMLRREDAWAQLERTEEGRGAQAELGWVLDPEYAGHGYATEAVVELLRFTFEELGVRRAVANCFLDNDSSWRLMERVGMRREGHAIRESLHRSGRWLDRSPTPSSPKKERRRVGVHRPDPVVRETPTVRRSTPSVRPPQRVSRSDAPPSPDARPDAHPTCHSVKTPSKENAMKAIVQDRYGSADVLELRDIDRPLAGDGEVLVRVHAAGLNRGTLHLMTGEPYLMRLMGFGLRKPKNPVPGQDVAGTIIAIGAKVTRLAVGDEVFGIANGSFAEYAVAREDKLTHKPEALTFEQAAVIGISGLTALQALDVARVAAGSSVLVVGASGGVGTYAVQTAVAMGAIVTGVASTSKTDLVAAAGADHVIDYTREDFADGARTYDVVLDIGGMTPVSRLRRALSQKGSLVIVGGEGDSTWSPGMGRQVTAMAVSPFVAQRLTMVINKEHHTGLERLSALATAGKVTSFIDRSYTLAEVPDAVRQLESGTVRGKVVITL